MSILHATPHSIRQDFDTRFVNMSVIDDLMAIFRPQLYYDKISDYPKEALDNVSKDFQVDHDSFGKTWKELRLRTK